MFMPTSNRIRRPFSVSALFETRLTEPPMEFAGWEAFGARFTSMASMLFTCTLRMFSERLPKPEFGMPLPSWVIDA